VKQSITTATETIRALGTTRIRRLTAPNEVEHRVRMLLSLAGRQLERGDTDSARATLIALRSQDFGRRARRAEMALAILHQHERPAGANELRTALHAFTQLLPPI
jgi:hypothetical protein